jgi:hypothetical protein
MIFLIHAVYEVLHGDVDTKELHFYRLPSKTFPDYPPKVSKDDELGSGRCNSKTEPHTALI